jgi:Ca2+-binding EF-hand superfamily protein
MRSVFVSTVITFVCVEAFPQQLATDVVATPKPQRQPVWFQKYDLNKNGVLDSEERKALQTHAENQRTAFILSMDKNGDGKIDSSEQWLAKSNQLAASGTTISTNRVK